MNLSHLAKLFNKSQPATRNGASDSASRFTLVCPARLNSGRSATWRMRAYVCLLSLATVCVFGCRREAQDAATISIRFGGITNKGLVATPKSVTAWRTDHSVSSGEPYEVSRLKQFTRLGVGVPVPPDLVMQLTNILLNEGSYISRDMADKCIHQPDLVLTFSDGARDLDLFFCMDCQIMLVKVGPGEKGQPPDTVDSDFTSAAAPKLAHVIKQIFPQDEAMQRLKDH